MQIYNDTPFVFSHAHSKFEPGNPFVTLVVKGTFRLVPGGICIPLPAEAQPPIAKSTKFEDEIGNSLRSETDMVAFKPRADCLFIGSAFAPEGQPVETLTVAFGVGHMRKYLVIDGDREWVRLADGAIVMTDQRSFVEMPIREERAHGGGRSRYNKHGIGFRTPGDTPGSSVPIANIRNLGEGTARWDEDAPSAGFGPIHGQSQPRRGLAGTFDDDWRYRRHPLPPADFDPGHLNAARADQQVEGFLKGDEELYFEHLHPDHQVLKSRLPGMKVRCFVSRSLDPQVLDNLEFAEILTCLDTCTVDMGAETVTLVWRGTIGTFDAAHTLLKYLLICQEPVTAPLDIGYYADLMERKIAASKAGFASPAEMEDTQNKIDALNAEGLSRAVDMLRNGKADPALIAKIEQQTDVDGAMAVIQEWLDAVKKSLPDVDWETDA